MNLLYNVDSSISQLLVMLLVNLTQLDAGIASLLQVCHIARVAFSSVDVQMSYFC